MKALREKLLLWEWNDYASNIDLFMVLFICAAMFTESCLPYIHREKKTGIFPCIQRGGKQMAGTVFGGICIAVTFGYSLSLP